MAKAKTAAGAGGDQVVRLSPEVHRKLKIRAAQEGLPLKHLLAKAVREYVASPVPAAR